MILWILLFYFILLIFFSDFSKPIGISLWIRTKLPVGIGSNWAKQQSARVYCSQHSASTACHTTHGQTAAISNCQPQNVIAFVKIDIDQRSLFKSAISYHLPLLFNILI